MAVNVRVSAQLKSCTGGRSRIEAASGSLAEVIGALDEAHPGLGYTILDDDGQLRRFVNVWVGGDNVNELQGLATRIGDGADITIMTAVAGG